MRGEFGEFWIWIWTVLYCMGCEGVPENLTQALRIVHVFHMRYGLRTVQLLYIAPYTHTSKRHGQVGHLYLSRISCSTSLHIVINIIAVIISNPYFHPALHAPTGQSCSGRGCFDQSETPKTWL